MASRLPLQSPKAGLISMRRLLGCQQVHREADRPGPQAWCSTLGRWRQGLQLGALQLRHLTLNYVYMREGEFPTARGKIEREWAVLKTWKRFSNRLASHTLHSLHQDSLVVAYCQNLRFTNQLNLASTIPPDSCRASKLMLLLHKQEESLLSILFSIVAGMCQPFRWNDLSKFLHSSWQAKVATTQPWLPARRLTCRQLSESLNRRSSPKEWLG